MKLLDFAYLAETHYFCKRMTTTTPSSTHSETEAFLDFLRFSLDEQAAVPASVAAIDWQRLREFSLKQSITGVLFQGIKRLKATDPHPDQQELMRWVALSLRIKQLNQQVYADADRLTKLLQHDGIGSVVIKGQSNALRYPDPYIRIAGDIDMWTTAPTVDLILWVRRRQPKATIGYHHIDFRCLKTIAELHFVPSFMGNLFYEWRLRKYFRRKKAEQFKTVVELPDGLGHIHVLQHDFDCVFQLTHMMHHFFFEGIGFRQLIDFYYLLKPGMADEERRSIMKTVKWLNMSKFAGSVMYIMRHVFGLGEELLLCPPDEKTGRILLSEILKAGNFGFYDQRYSFAGKSVYRQYFIEIWRNLHFALQFPSETIWGRPVSRWWHMIYKAWLRRQVRKREQ